MFKIQSNLEEISKTFELEIIGWEKDPTYFKHPGDIFMIFYVLSACAFSHSLAGNIPSKTTKFKSVFYRQSSVGKLIPFHNQCVQIKGPKCK